MGGPSDAQARALERALSLAEGFAASGRFAAQPERVEAEAQAALGISAGKAVPEAARHVAGVVLNALTAARAFARTLAHVALSAAEAGKVAARAARFCALDVTDAVRGTFEELAARQVVWVFACRPGAAGLDCPACRGLDLARRLGGGAMYRRPCVSLDRYRAEG